MNKVIAIDIGDVCLRRRLNLSLKAFGLDTDTLPPPIAFAIDQYERGKISLEEWIILMQRDLPGCIPDDEVCRGWNMMIGEEMPGMNDFVREMVAAGFRFVFFSDTSELHFTDICRKLPFANQITGAILSYEVGAKKPESGMYEAFENKYGIPCCYLDDMPQNIAAGQERGWFSIRFENTEAMRQEFYSEFHI